MTGNVSYDFTGAVVAITGGARGMGLAHARGFAQAGGRVAILDLGGDLSAVPYPMSSADDIESARKELAAITAEDPLALRADVREEPDVRDAIAAVIGHWGRLDILINNAGVNSISPVPEMSREEWQQVIDVNLTGAFLCCKYSAPAMMSQRAGKIVNISSGAGLSGVPKQAHYSAAKHGLIGFTKSLALELGPYGVNVNAVCPSVVITPQSEGLSRSYPAGLDEMRALYGIMHPLTGCEVLETRDVTAAVMWLSSADARYVTGTILAVDAGFSAK